MKVYAAVRLPDYPAASNFRFSGNATIGSMMTVLFRYLFPLAGLLSLLMVIWGGFLLMFSAGNPDGVKNGTNKIVYGVGGFILVFVSYWLTRIIGLIFGIEVW